MKEIGGYFGLEEFPNHSFYPNLIALNTARNALLYILKAKRIKRIFIPDYLCDSIAQLCEREGYDYSYYSIRPDFQPSFNGTLHNDEYLYIVNYYGQLSDALIMELKGMFRNIIIDNVQAFFHRPLQGIDTIYSCRKFFGVPDGAYLATDVLLEEPLKKDESAGRMIHVLGRYERTASEFYQDYVRNDDSYSELELRSMSKITKNILGVIDYGSIQKKREINYKYLHEHLGRQNIINLICAPGPYAYPFYCRNGFEIKKSLAKKNIYVPTLWPAATAFDGLAKDYSENILPLPVDQRYDTADMKLIVEVLSSCMKN